MKIKNTKPGDIIAVTLHGSNKRVVWIVAKPTENTAIIMPLQDVEITLDLTDQPKLLSMTDDSASDITILEYTIPPSELIPTLLPEYLI